jgi:hypothetical protein
MGNIPRRELGIQKTIEYDHNKIIENIVNYN